MWKKTEPVRNYLYTLLFPVAALLVGYGWVSSEHMPLWVGVATAVLGVPVVESARRRVQSRAWLESERPPVGFTREG